MTNALPENLKLDGRYPMSQVATILGIDPATLWRWRRDGKIRISGYFQANGRPFIKGKEIVRAYRCY